MIEAVGFTDQTGSVNPSAHSSTSTSQLQLSRRCALFTWVAMSVSIGTGLLAWGPIGSPSESHVFAAHGVDVLLSLPMLLAGVWGWHALARSHWPETMQVPWRWCFGSIALSVGLSLICHWVPGDLSRLAEQAATAAASVLLLCGFLAERVDARWGSRRTCFIAIAAVTLAGVASWFNVLLLGQMDLRPLLLLLWWPTLLVPSGALSLHASHTTTRDWQLILGLWATAQLFDLGNSAVMGFTDGALSGHALMHLCLAGAAAWLGYRASTVASVACDDDAVLTQANTSLNTSG